ncbi:MAG: hypothetical protein ABI852_03370 [Gemmatimonadaceae bacterium]
MNRSLLALPIALLSACAFSGTPVPVIGTPRALDRIAGQWQGEYISEETGRSGTIGFTLKAGTDSAFGEVVMSDNRALEVRGNETSANMAVRTRPMTMLTIRFVQAAGHEVRGEMDPYSDPRCACILRTHFIGVVEQNSIQGTFTSEGSEIFHQPTHGTWRVARIAESARAPADRP